LRKGLVPSILPKISEAAWSELSVSDRIADVAVSEVVLNCSSIVAIASEFVSRTMPQHVCVSLKRQSRFLTRALHQPIEPIG